MALPKRTSIKDLEEVIEQLTKKTESLTERLDALEKTANSKPISINKIETFNGDVEPKQREKTNLEMNNRSKLASMTNAVAILPPNLLVNGRHDKTNVAAICGFEVTDAMLEAVYSK